MLNRRSLFLITCVATIAAFLAEPSMASADVAPDVAQSVLLDQTAVRKVIAGIAIKLREDYVFPDMGEQAAAALEKALAENVYAGVTDPSKFAAQLTGQLRAIARDSHMRVIFGSPFRNQPTPSTPQDAGFEVKRLDGNIGYAHLARFVPPDVLEFAYDLQVLKRVTVVGETTRGGANPGGLNDVGSDLFVVVPTGRAENPITRTNWGGVGVRPDEKATSEAARETAMALAMRELNRQSAR